MAKTGEGKVKDDQRDYFLSLGMIRATKPDEDPKRPTELEDSIGWFYMPVQMAGSNGIADFIGHYYGHFFGIESKRPGRRGEKNHGASALQQLQGKAINASGAFWIVADSVEQIKPWFEKIKDLHTCQY